MRHVLRPDLRDRSPQKSQWGSLVAQVRVLNAALSIASPYTIANNDLLGIVEPRDASRVSMLGFFQAIHQVMRSMMITGFAIFSVHAGGYEPSRRRKPPNIPSILFPGPLGTPGSVGYGFARYRGAVGVIMLMTQILAGKGRFWGVTS